MRSSKWIITEHRQIVFESVHEYSEEDARRIALAPDHKGQACCIVSDRTQRNSYPVSGSVSEDDHA